MSDITITSATGILANNREALRELWENFSFHPGELSADEFYKEHQGKPAVVRITFPALCDCERSANTLPELEALIGEKCPHGGVFVGLKEASI